MRIVTFLPSATEMVCALGLEDSLVGVSHECDYPPAVGDLPKVTRTRLNATASSAEIDQQVRELSGAQAAIYELQRAVLARLEPDLLVTQSLCSVCAVSEEEVLELASQLPSRPNVVRLGPTSLDEMLDGMKQLGEAAGVAARAEEVIASLKSRVAAVSAKSLTVDQRPSVLLLEWIDPPFCAGHWNPELVKLAGGQDVFGVAGARSHELAWDDVLAADPDVMVIACCGFSIDRTLDDLPKLVSYREFAKLKCIGSGQVYLTDGSQFFNRPGPRLVDSLELLAHTLHPGLHALPEHLEPAVRIKREPKPARGHW